ncbi:hypothetical protein B0T17DRAFT_541102 [Bombardia bombarda]|uniref:Uncharacterized protein n=1 Tax=Bombardia bombarda TaxID=252184 RepID=A0AA39WGV7_9PEZI|nr:hypothetical protein B0T17DRAFT_541102 [Bombardia bombarda]
MASTTIDMTASTGLDASTGAKPSIDLKPYEDALRNGDMTIARDELSKILADVSKEWGPTDPVDRHNIDLLRRRNDLFEYTIFLRDNYVQHFKGHLDFGSDKSLQLAKLMIDSAWHEHEKGNSAENGPSVQLAEEICEKNPDHRQTADVLFNVHYTRAAAANETNDIKGCLHHTEGMIKVCSDVGNAAQSHHEFPEIYPALAHNERGIALVMNAQYDDGVKMFEASIGLYNGLPDYWAGMDTNPRTNLGFTLWVTGKPIKAEVCLTSLLKDRVAKFGSDDRESYRTGRVYHGLGNVYYGAIDEVSESWHKKALAQYRDTIGSDHHKTADLCHRVAQHHLRRREFNIARTLIDQALEVYAKRKLYRPELARTTFLKIKLEAEDGNEEAAAKLLQDATEMREKVLKDRGLPVAPNPDGKPLVEEDFDDLVTFFTR